MKVLISLSAAVSTSRTYFAGGAAKALSVFVEDRAVAADLSELQPKVRGSFVVTEAKLSIKKPASEADVQKAVRATGVTEDDLGLDHDLDDDSEWLNSPKIVKWLHGKGFDGYVGEGPFDAITITKIIPFNASQIKSASVTKVN